jgi:hypothetical protein
VHLLLLLQANCSCLPGLLMHLLLLVLASGLCSLALHRLPQQQHHSGYLLPQIHTCRLRTSLLLLLHTMQALLPAHLTAAVAAGAAAAVCHCQMMQGGSSRVSTCWQMSLCGQAAAAGPQMQSLTSCSCCRQV